MTEAPKSSAPQPTPDDVVLARRVFFGMMAALAILLGSLAWGALR